MKVGFLAAPMHPFESYRMMVSIAEDANVDSVWVPDHLLGCAHPALWPDMALASVSPDADAWYDPFPCIGVIGQESDLPVGVCVTDAIRRRAPDVERRFAASSITGIGRICVNSLASLPTPRFAPRAFRGRSNDTL